MFRNVNREFNISLTIYIYFKSATTFLSCDSGDIALVERRKHIMNFKVRTKQKHMFICHINEVDSVTLDFERTEEVTPSGIALCLC